ncbi:ATP-binding protein [Herbaspirillum rubrisubalbicans]|uniref:Uncharacterized protein n=1 Tax=Herbaspirillum rubrisubalbicans TaxID=80842 RepID=A0ABX9BYQ4_9BURK|nr:ATP-binding protein [Herbaspirillum rubrisubalbicans]RAM63155.1 hypothetical protein RB24_17685 [Herbaspirillum rubrisubalbicans]
MTIKRVEIENIRGISSLVIENWILKNRPNILVASNGFGKTSIATAFKCLAGRTFIDVSDENRHLHKEANHSIVRLEYEEAGTTVVVEATEEKYTNDIRKNFDVLVISDMRRIKASAQNMGQFSHAKGRQVIDPIAICAKVHKAKSPYKYTDAIEQFGLPGRVLPNLDNTLFDSAVMRMRSPELTEVCASLAKEGKWGKLESIRRLLVDANEDQALIEIEALGIDTEFAKAMKLVTGLLGIEIKPSFMVVWQLVLLHRADSAALKAYWNWLRYGEIKKSLKNQVADLNVAWKTASVSESKETLEVVMPDPAHISNGQRDILLLVAQFHAAKHQLVKDKSILIIDELFDYLDDANLTAAQFYISQLIEEFARQKRTIYPVILTHLNPAFFRNYVFSNQNVIHLDKNQDYQPEEAMRKLIAARDNNTVPEEIKNKISRYLVHYSGEQFDFSDGLAVIKGTRPSWGKTGVFQNFLVNEFRKYEEGQSYDPLAICAITRRSIERAAFEQIASAEDALDFYTVHKTVKKLDWARERGSFVPEMHYLLRIIFDDGLHWNPSRDNTIPIVAKLGNPVIKKMILDSVNAYLN